jgi:predicted ester cyclase
MSIEENKQLVLRWREELWHKRNVNALDELCAPDYVGHIAGTPGPVQGREAFKQLITAYLAALDIRVTTEFLIADGDMVAVRDTNRVKSTGEFRGMPPTGKEATLTSTDIYRIAGGQVVEQWFEADVTGLLQELGVWPAPGQAGS